MLIRQGIDELLLPASVQRALWLSTLAMPIPVSLERLAVIIAGQPHVYGYCCRLSHETRPLPDRDDLLRRVKYLIMAAVTGTGSTIRGARAPSHRRRIIPLAAFDALRPAGGDVLASIDRCAGMLYSHCALPWWDAIRVVRYVRRMMAEEESRRLIGF